MHQRQVPGWQQLRILFTAVSTFIGLSSSSFAELYSGHFAPWTAVEGRDGKFYGSMAQGGVPGGCAYALSPKGKLSRPHIFKRILYSTENNLRGGQPQGGVSVGQDGAIYGSTAYGGAFGSGLLYKVDRLGKYSALFHYRSPGNSKGPTFSAQNGDLFAAVNGDVLRLAKDGSHIIIPADGYLVSLTETATHDIILGSVPNSGYGGILSRLNGSNQFEFLADVGDRPHRLLPLPDGSFLCITWNRILQVSSVGAVSVIHDFTLQFEGLHPVSLFVDTDGSYVGSTFAGGLENAGTVFRIVPGSNDFTVLSHLPAADGRGAGVMWMREVFPLLVQATANHPPFATDDVVASSALRSVAGSFPQTVISVLANDGDADREPVQIAAVGTPAHGTATLDSVTQRITYTANSATPENDTFTYTIADGNGGTAVGTVVIRTNSVGRYTGDVSTTANPGTGDPGTTVGSLIVTVRGNRLAAGRIDFLGKTYRFAGRFNDANQLAAVFESNTHLGKFCSLQLWLRPDGAGWTVEATIQKNYVPFSASCALEQP